MDELGGVVKAVEAAKAAAGLPLEPGKMQLLEWPPRRVPPALALLKGSGARALAQLRAQWAMAGRGQAVT